MNPTKIKTNTFLAFLALLLLSVSLLRAQSPLCPGDGFGGSKDHPVTSINPQISMVDSVGEAPFSVHVSAEQTTATGIASTYEHLEFSWDFGDPGAGYSFNHPVWNLPVDPNTDQQGPEGTFIYQTPGTYTITLQVRGWDGNNYVSSSISKQITVMPNTNAVRYFDPANGNDNNTGLDSTQAWQTWSQLNNWLTGSNNRTALIKRGTILPATFSMVLITSNLQIGTYGTGSRPIIRAQSNLNGSSIIDLNGGVGSIANHHYEDVVFDCNKGMANAGFSSYNPTGGPVVENITFANCRFETDSLNGGLVVFTGDGPKRDVLSWNCEHESNDGYGLNYFAYRTQYFRILGGYFSGGTGGGIFEHYVYSNDNDHALFRWIDFQPNNGGKNFCLNMNTVTDSTTTDFTLVDGCDVTGTNNGIDWSNVNSSNDGHFRWAIVQNTAVHDLGEGQGVGMFLVNIREVTIRNSYFYNNDLEDLRVEDDDIVLNLYQNRFYNDGSHGNDQVALWTTTGSVSMRRNTFQQDGSWASIIGGNFATLPGMLSEGNQFYAPNNSTPFYESGQSTGYDFAGWQGLGYDLNGSVANPLWPAPGNGDFGRMAQADFSSVVMTDSAMFTNQTQLNPAGWALTYSWNFGDGSPADTLTNPLHVYAQPGSYPVMLSATNACGTSTHLDTVVIDSIPDGVEELLLLSGVQLWPNPARGKVQVGNLPTDAKADEIEVFNLQGQKMQVGVQKVSGDTFQLDLNEIPGGIYILRYQGSSGWFGARFIRSGD